MKRSIIALVILMAACSATTTETPTTPSTLPRPDLVTYAGEGFSIGYPTGWKVETEPGLATFTAPAPISGFTDNFNVSFGDVPDSMRLAYYEGEAERMRQYFGDIKIFEDLDVTVDGAPAKALTFTATNDANQVGISRLVVQRNDTAFEITFFSTPERLQELTAVVQDVFASFHFDS